MSIQFLGRYRATKGMKYDCTYSPDDKKAVANPMPDGIDQPATIPAFDDVDVIADTVEHAKRELETRLGDGQWI